MVNEIEATNMDISRLAALAVEIESLRRDYQPMPDEVMDLLTEAGAALADVVMDAPAATMGELSAKMQMLAATHADDNAFDPALIERLAILQSEAKDIARDQYGASAVN